MYYTIYKVTNKLDGKYYIGKHQTENLDDGYLGSGILIKRAIKKHGINNFHKEILFIFNSEKEMNDKEKEIVVVSEDTYNLCPGGQGGFGYINDNGLAMNTIKAKTMYLLGENGRNKWRNSEEGKRYYNTFAKIGREKIQIKYPNGTWKNKKHSEETKLKISNAHKGKVPWNKGIPRTKEEKEKIRNGVLNRQ